MAKQNAGFGYGPKSKALFWSSSHIDNGYWTIYSCTLSFVMYIDECRETFLCIGVEFAAKRQD